MDSLSKKQKNKNIHLFLIVLISATFMIIMKRGSTLFLNPELVVTESFFPESVSPIEPALMQLPNALKKKPVLFRENVRTIDTAAPESSIPPKIEPSASLSQNVRIENREQPGPPEKVDEDPCYNCFPWPKRITARHVIGHQDNRCIPFASNFTTFEIFFAPDYRVGKILPFVDLRGHRFDNNTYAANIGIGGRSIPYCDSRFCELLGFNAYYDYRQGCLGYYQQLGLGIEVLGRRWDFRANVYVPFGHKNHIHSCFFNHYVGDFFATRRDIESVSYSFNGEIGYLVYSCEDFLLYAAGGPYFLARGKCSTSTPGGEIRIRPQYQDYVALDLSWRYDSLFRTIWQAEIIFNLPLYQLSDRNQRPCGITDRQIYQPIERFEVLPLGKRSCWKSNF